MSYQIDLKILYELKLGESIFPDSVSSFKRVPWWWIYWDNYWVCFVPFNNEFQ